MLRSFEEKNIRVLIRYCEMPVYKQGGQELETLPGNQNLVKQQHGIVGVEIIDVHTQSIINISFNAAMCISENIREILEETPPPINVSDAEINW